jgi:Zn finger protein HypA/HybF involved in hydrogenase expression
LVKLLKGEYMDKRTQPKPPNTEEPIDTPQPVDDTGVDDGLFRMEQAATLLINQLPQNIRDFALEVSDIVLKIPRWQFVSGCMLARYEEGMLQAPSLEPGWVHDTMIEVRSVCEMCGETFEPKRLKQRFCSNECGGKYNRRQASATG